MKILIVCESARKHESGGRVVRYLTKILKSGNHQVKLVILNNDPAQDDFYKETDFEFIPIREGFYTRFANIFLVSKESLQFRTILKQFSPDVVHFASFDNGKPPQFFTEAKNSGATVVLQPWTMQFYCEQGFGFRDGKKCNLCAGGDFTNALKMGCTTYGGIPALIKKKRMHKRALMADIFLSSNSELDEILLTYGVAKDKIARFTVPFDYTFMVPEKRPEQDYSIFYGQPNAHKGLGVLKQVFEMLPSQKLKIYPLALPSDTFKTDNVEIVNGASWAGELPAAIASAKTVLVPSLWSTSTEYSMCEALMFKKPVVVFNTGVHKHIFKNGVNAMVLEAGDVDGYAKALVELNTNDELRKTIAENGYQTLVDVNCIENLYPRLIKAYTQNKEN
jgi:glycosyltransferase involved in cell wall biosynthesis